MKLIGIPIRPHKFYTTNGHSKHILSGAWDVFGMTLISIAEINPLE